MVTVLISNHFHGFCRIFTGDLFLTNWLLTSKGLFLIYDIRDTPNAYLKKVTLPPTPPPPPSAIVNMTPEEYWPSVISLGLSVFYSYVTDFIMFSLVDRHEHLRSCMIASKVLLDYNS